MTTPIASDLCDFIAQSPSPFHATATLLQMFQDAGFEQLQETQEWNIEKNKAYVITKNDSSIIAFRSGTNPQQGIRMLGAHTDSPCLRIKPQPELDRAGCNQLGVEVYGGALLQPWLDRDLSIAGRVSGLDSEGDVISTLVDFQRPIGIIPNLAIHLEREANTKRVINPQLHLPMIVGQSDEFEFDRELLLQCKGKISKVLEYELSCYDTQRPGIIGLNSEFIVAARIDNLLSSYLCARAIIDTGSTEPCLYVSNDHEEVGSASACGAQGPFLRSFLARITSGPEQFAQLIARSTMLSCDNAHAAHPNYIDKHDGNHGPILNQGPVIKINNNQRYASNSVSSAKFKQICENSDIPYQTFVTRSDLACGSTIGPITATEIGIETLDIGAPQWGMHSIRETAGTQDCDYLYRALCAYTQ